MLKSSELLINPWFLPIFKNKFLKIGRNKGFISNSEDISTLTIKENNVVEILKSKKIIIGSAVLGLILLIAVISFV